MAAWPRSTRGYEADVGLFHIPGERDLYLDGVLTLLLTLERTLAVRPEKLLSSGRFDLRSWLSVSLPLRSVGTPSPPSRESRFFKPRNNLEPCTDSLELCRRVWHRRKSEQRTFG